MGKQKLKDRFVNDNDLLKTPSKISLSDRFGDTNSVTPNSSVLSSININDYTKYNDDIRVGLGKDALNKQRAESQSTGSQVLNAAGQLVPAIGLGIVENLGYLLELPNALGASDKKDYSNAMVEWAKSTRKEVDEALPIYRENPNEVFDMSDGAWWVQHGLGLTESIGEFLVTGAGVGGALSKSAQLAAKITGSTAVAKGSAALAQGLTAATLAYTEGAISGSEIYKEVYAKELKETGDAESANKRASEAASKTVKMNTGINTFLNLSGIAPLFTKNSNSLLKAGLTKRVGEKNYLKRLSTEMDNIKAINPKITDNILRESIQEGVEEQVNLISEIEGRLEGGLVTEEEVGKSFAERIKNAISSEEGILSFGLGAFGGAGQNAGVNIISQNERKEKSIQDQVNEKQRLQNVINLIDKVDNSKQKMSSLILEGKIEEANDIKNDIFNVVSKEYVKNNTGEALINTLREIESVDNKVDLREQLEEQLQEEVNTESEDPVINLARKMYKGEQVTSPEELQIQQNSTKELETELTRLQNVAKQAQSLTGVTEAMRQGLAENIDDNKYKTTAKDKVAEIKKLESKYQELQLKYNTTLDEKQSNVAEIIFDKYANKEKFDKNYSSKVSEKTEFQTSLSNRNIPPEQISNYNNVSKKKALIKLKDFYEGIEKSKLSKVDKLYTFDTLDKKKINQLSKERLVEINKELELISEVENPILDTRILENGTEVQGKLYQSEFLKNEANREYTELTQDKSKREEIIGNKKKEISKFEKEVELQEEKKENKERIAQVEKDEEEALAKITSDKIKALAKKIEDDKKSSEENIQNDGELTNKVELDFNEDSEIAEINQRKEEDLNTIQQVESLIGDVFISNSFKGRNSLEEIENDIKTKYDDEIADLNKTKAFTPKSKEYEETAQFTKNPTKGLKIPLDESKKEVQDEKESPKVIEASIAFGNKAILDNNILNEKYHAILMTGTLKEGDNITISIDRELKTSGKEITETDYEVFKTDVNKVPLVIKKGKEVLGHLHTLNWINENTVVTETKTVSDNVGMQKELLLALRNHVIDNGGKIKTTISLTGGESVLSKTDKVSSISELIPEIEIGLVTSMGVEVNGTRKEVSNDVDFLEEYSGKLVTIMPRLNSELPVAAPASMSTVSEKHAELLYDAISTYLNQKENTTSKLIASKVGLNILKRDGLESFVSNYVFVSKKDSKLIFANETSEKRYFKIGNETDSTTNRIILQQEGEKPTIINKENLNDLTKIEFLSHVGDMFYNINKSNFNSEFVDEIGEELVKVPYQDHIKKVGMTNLKPREVTYKNKEYKSYFENPMFYIESPIDESEIRNRYSSEEIKPKKEDNIISDNQSEIDKVKNESSVDLKKLVDFGFGQYDGNTKTEIDLSPAFAENDERYKKLKSSLRDSLGTDPNVTEDISNTLAVELIKRSYKVKNPIQNLREDLIAKGVFSNPDNYLELARIKLARVGAIRNNLKNSDFGDDIDTSFERNSFSDDGHFSIDNKFNASSNIKKLFYIIPDIDSNNNIKVGNTGTKYLPIDSVFNTLKTILADTEASYDVMIAKLEDNVTKLPWLKVVIEILETPESQGVLDIDIQRVRNQFVRLMANSNYESKTIIIDNKGNHRVISSNQQSTVRLIVDTWKENIKSTDLVTETEDGFEINKLEAKEILDQYSEFKKSKHKVNSKESIEFLKDTLPKFGIEISNSTINTIVNDEIDGNYLPSSLYKTNGLIGMLFTKLSYKLDVDSEFEQKNPLFNNSRVLKLAEIEAKTSNYYQSTSFINVEGNNINSINLNREFTRRNNELKNTNKAKDLVEIPFNRNSNETWLNNFSSKNNDFLNIFSLELLNGITNEEEFDSGVTSNSLSPRQQEISKIAMFLNNDDNDVSRFLHFIPSKNTTLSVKAPKLKGLQLIDGKVNDVIIDKMYSIVKSEIDRINEVDHYGNNGKKFYIFDSLNNPIEGEDGKTINVLKDKKAIVTKEIEQIIRFHLKNQLQAMIDDKMKVWKNLGVINDKNKLSLNNNYDSVNEVASDFVVNQIWFNYNMMQSFIGDPAQFGKGSVDATWDAFFKRLTKDVAPYSVVPKDNNNLTYLQVALVDRETPSKYIESIPKEYRVHYESIESTDAQEFTTLEEHLFLLKQYGDISTENYNSISEKAKVNGFIDLTEIELKAIFKPMKPVATGKRVIYENGIPVAEVSDYVKSSSVPLIPQFTKGLPIDKLRVAMEKLQVMNQGKLVRASYKTANKLGNGKPLNIWNEDGSINDFEINDVNFEELQRDSFGIQQEVPVKENNLTDGSQQRKLILSALYSSFSEKDADRIYGEYNNTYRKIYDDASSSFESEILNEDGSINNVKLHDFLKEEAESRGWGSEDLKYLELDDKNNFKIPLFYNNLSSRVEPLLASIINNRILKIKRNGNSLVLRSQEGFQGNNPNTIYTDSYDGELKPSRWENKDGNVISADTKGAIFKPAQALVPRSMFKKMVDGRMVELSTKELMSLDKSVLQSFGYRIPTNDYNTMSAMEIVGFLPKGEEAGIIVPREFVVQMGSDFDVDKLNLFTYEVELKDDKFVKIDNDNKKLLDLDIEIMSNKNVYKLTVEPLLTDKLKEQIKKEKSSELDKIYDQNYSNKYNDSIDGALGIGSFSTLSTFLSVSYNIKEEITFKNVKELEFSDIKANDINNPIAKDGRTKIQINSQFLQASLDNEKEPLLGKINANKNTFGAIQAMITLGYNESQIIPFINQPIIREYLNNFQFILENGDRFDPKVKEKAFRKTVKANLDEKTKFQVDSKSHLSTDPIIVESNLRHFLKLQEAGKELQSVKSAISTDSTFAPKTLLESFEKENDINNLNESLIENADKLLGDFTEDDDSRYLSDPINISGFNSYYGIVKANEIWEKLDYPYNQAFVRSSFSEIEAIYGKKLTIENKKEISKNIKDFSYSSAVQPIIKDNVFNERRRLLTGDDSLAKRVEKAKKVIKNNIFLELLYVKKNESLDVINFNNAATQGLNEDYIHNSFKKLLTDERSFKLAEDLIIYTLLTNSNINPKSFIKFIPAEYITAMGINKSFVLNFENSDTDNFINQFVRNNPRYAKRINQEEVTWNEDFTEFEDKSDSVEKYKSFYSEKLKHWKLYVLNDNLEYTEISTLGKGSILKEYDYSSEYFDSVIKTNNVKTNRVKPTNIKPVESNSSEPNLNYLSELNTDSPKELVKDLLGTNILNKIDRLTNNQRLLLELFDKVGLNSKLKIDKIDDNGFYDPDTNTIELDNSLSETRFIDTFIHESIHSLTSNVVNQFNKDKSKLTSDQIKFVNQLEGLRVNYFEKLSILDEESRLSFDKKFEYLKSKDNKDKYLDSPFTYDERKFYNVHNVKEFIVSVFTDEDVMLDLNIKKFEGEKTLIERFVEVISNFLNSFGFNIKSGSELEEAIRNSLGIINSIIDLNNEESSLNDKKIEGSEIQIDLSFDASPISSEQKELLDNNLKVQQFEKNKLFKDQVQYQLQAISILQSDKAEQAFKKGEKNSWDLNKILTELQIPKEQKQIILQEDFFDTYFDDVSLRDNIIMTLAARNSFVVEVNTAKETKETSKGIYRDGYKFEVNGNVLEVKDINYAPNYFKNGVKITFDEFLKEEDKYVKSTSTNINTSYYSNLTVPGGTNYTENEISTPVITPNIKGHAQFSTNNGIGWFRSDEQANGLTDMPSDLIKELQATGEYNEVTSKFATKTRRILEVQSDLFQKGRDGKDLVSDKKIKNSGTPELNIFGTEEFEFEYENSTYESRVEMKYYIEENQSEPEEIYYKNGEKISEKEFTTAFKEKSSKEKDTLNNDNQFLQLLNKKGNWVNFFIQSIVQDSIKKGYEKVLFPTGDTASKVEGHTTLEGFKKEKEDRIKELENNLYYVNVSTATKVNRTGFKTKAEAEVFAKTNNSVVDKSTQDEKEINTLKAELERVEIEGFGALRPIFNFYENRVTNILNKLYNVNQITDEHGNTWNEITLLQSSKKLSNYEEALEYQIKLNSELRGDKLFSIIEKVEGGYEVRVIENYNHQIDLMPSKKDKEYDLHDEVKNIKYSFQEDKLKQIKDRIKELERAGSNKIASELKKRFDKLKDLSKESQIDKFTVVFLDGFLSDLIKMQKAFNGVKELHKHERFNDIINFINSNSNIFEELSKLYVNNKELESKTKNVFTGVASIYNSLKAMVDIHDEMLTNEFGLSSGLGDYRNDAITNEVSKDIGMLQFQAGNIFNINHPLIKNLAYLITNIKAQVDIYANRVGRTLLNLQTNFVNSGKKVDDLIEGNSLISEYNIELYEKERDATANSVLKLFDEDKEIAIKLKLEFNEKEFKTKEEKELSKLIYKIWKDFDSKYHDYIGYDSIIISKESYDNIYLGEKFDYKNPQHKVGTILNITVDKKDNNRKAFVKVIEGDKVEVIDSTDLGLSNSLLNPKYEKIKNDPYYKELVSILENEKEKLPTRYRTGKYKYMIPQIEERYMNYLKQGDFKKGFAQWSKEFGTREDDSVIFGESKGYKDYMLPIHYVNPIDSNNLSKDLAYTFREFARMSEQFSKFKKEEKVINSVRRQVAKSNFKKNKKDAKGRDTNTFKMMESFVERFVYDVHDTTNIEVGKVNVSKLLDKVSSWIRNSNLGFNFPSQVAGQLHAKLDFSIEKLVGEYTDIEADRFAMKEVLKNIGGLTEIITRPRVRTNKLGLILDDAGMISSPKTIYGDSNINNKLSKIMDSELFYLSYAPLDFELKGRIMIGLMYNTRYVNGKWINKNNYTGKKDFKSYENMYDQISTEGNQVVLSNKLSLEDYTKIIQVVQKDSARIEGRLNDYEKGVISRNALGRMVMTHRSWLSSGFEYRFKERQVDRATGREEEGTLRTLHRVYLEPIFSAILSKESNLKDAFRLWKDLNEFEKRQLKRVTLDLINLALITGGATLLNNIDLDDDDEFLSFIVYSMNRLTLEQSAFWSPNTFFELTESPAAGINTIKDTANMLRMFVDFEPLKTGIYKDHYRFTKFLIQRGSPFKNIYELTSLDKKNKALKQIANPPFLIQEPLDLFLKDDE